MCPSSGSWRRSGVGDNGDDSDDDDDNDNDGAIALVDAPKSESWAMKHQTGQPGERLAG
jgi:hypothetical protein